jgi:hypothetical protein
MTRGSIFKTTMIEKGLAKCQQHKEEPGTATISQINVE